MSDRTVVKPERYAYLSGRIRAMELMLLDSARYSRLYEARTKEDISRILTESGYPEARDPEDSLRQEEASIYELLRGLMPNPEFIDVMLVFHDFHNIKVILKYLSPWWSKSDDMNTEPQAVPEISEDQDEKPKPSLQTIEELLQKPASIEVRDLFQALAERQPGQVPEWAYDTAAAAIRSYRSSYDIADIDLVLDRRAYAKALADAAELHNEYFTLYLRQRIDLINLGVLLRTRQLQSGRDLLSRSILAGGTISTESIIELYGADNEAVNLFFSKSRYSTLAEFTEKYGERDAATRFSRESDNILMHHISKAKYILSGPEIPLAYLFAREMEVRNVRIILACLRNGLPMGRARDMARDSYLAWR